jgi:hypothetical protein
MQSEFINLELHFWLCIKSFEKVVFYKIVSIYHYNHLTQYTEWVSHVYPTDWNC